MNTPDNQEQTHNPYSAPNMNSLALDKETEYTDNHFGLLTAPRKCDAGRGITWFTQSFAMIKDNPLFWIVSGLIMLVINIAGNYIPIINFLFVFITFHFFGSFMLIGAKQAEGDTPEYGDIFSAFQTHFVPLLILFLLYMLLFIVVLIPICVLAFIMFGSAITSGNIDALSSPMVMIFSLLAVAAIIPVFMCIYFATPLIVLHDMSPTNAMKMSFKGCLKNMIPLFVLSLITIIALPLLVVFTLGLGLLLLYPFTYIINYSCYRDIFSERMLDQ